MSEIETVAPWVKLENAITPYYSSSGGCGRPPIGLVLMLRMYVAQQCFGVSDGGAEVVLYDSQAIRRFVGVDLSHEAAPDATTLLNFLHLREALQLTESIFNTVNAHLAEKGLFLREGTIVDATLIAAAPSIKNGKREENLALPVTWHVAMRLRKRRALPNSTESELLERIEHTKASIRAKVERPFHVVENLFRHPRRATKDGLKIPPSCSRCSVSLI